MIKIISCFLCSLGLSMTLSAQQNTVAAGGELTGSGGSASYTIGQPFYTVKGTTTTLTEGVQQPYEVYISVDKIQGIDLTMKAYPNPTAAMLYLEIEEFSKTGLQWRLFDATGKLLSQKEVTDQTSPIPMQNLVTGTYILQVTEASKTIQSFTIIKN